MGMRNIHVTGPTRPPVEQMPIEFVERKGKGHPDTLCDKAVEELSIALSRFYRSQGVFDYRIQHHNVDKCVLVGGQSFPRYGGGEVVEPIYLLMVGRAILEDRQRTVRVPLAELAIANTLEWLRRDLPHLRVPGDIIVDYRIRPGSPDLIETFNRGQVPLANDTSFGVSFGPLSETERLVKETELLLNAWGTKQKYPAIGEDIKVMGLRTGEEIRLTISVAFVDRYVADRDAYEGMKEEIVRMVQDLAESITRRRVWVAVNTADPVEREGSVYLTVTGTSAECGDDGQVGRGNRANGLITPYRPMTLEAAAGKNPVSHVGKIYNATAQRIVGRILEEIPEVKEVFCYILSQIGHPITEPKALNLEILSDKPLSIIAPHARRIAEEVLDDWMTTQEGFLERRWTVYY